MPTQATSFATGLILCSVSFSLGVIYSNWAYDYFTLWVSRPTEEAFLSSLEHYKAWYRMPPFLAHFHHFVMGFGFIGLFTKLYKPSESNKLFDGGALFLYVIAVVFYITNLVKGVATADSGNWGDINYETGVNVIAASQVFIVLVLLGVVGLQLGQYWAEKEDERILEEFQKSEQNEAAKSKKEK